MRGAVCECTRGAGRVEVRWDRLSSYLKVKVVQSCTTLFDPIDYTVRAILQARILEWVAFPSSRGSSQPRNQSDVHRCDGHEVLHCRQILYQRSYQGSALFT